MLALMLITWPLSVFGAGRNADHLERIAEVLDDFHAAASESDLDRYIGHFADEGVFLGTDASERWTRDEFLAFCKPYFNEGRGWSYQPKERRITVLRGGRHAFFDELLWNESYGTCRSTGSLVRRGGRWLLVQYSLSFPVPNEVAKDVIGTIRKHEGN